MEKLIIPFLVGFFGATIIESVAHFTINQWQFWAILLFIFASYIGGRVQSDFISPLRKNR